jgi:predicted ArsR family transcriptional regulator
MGRINRRTAQENEQRVLLALADGQSRSAAEVAGLVGLTRSVTRFHLDNLEAAGEVERMPHTHMVEYRAIKGEAVA